MSLAEGETFVSSPLLQSTGASHHGMQRSHDKFKSVFDATTAVDSTRSVRRTSVSSDAASVNRFTLLFERHLHENWFVTKFYSHNQHSAVVGLLVLLGIVGIAGIVVVHQGRPHYASYKISLI
ncbi:transmembrane protein, putative [Bodo saltans]|uniref:Transmembrane protein, putative n=1 Tax=Bodo saltans TaxID=75058 RepID=A0A0S4KJR6_BODSA|nr:transmembrane protein, putative [Bodo saltans]|eukprot:CUI14644.1 transmembrane protein, putative [Bodo saltans]